MSEPKDSCIIWNQLENSSLVSQIGDNGAEHGSPDYVPGKFNNAVRINADNEAVYWLNTNDRFLQPEGIAEWWLKPVGWSITDAKASADLHFVFSINVININFFDCYFNGNGLNVRIRRNNVNYFPVAQVIPEIDVADGEWFHFFIAWNEAGIDGGSNKWRIYFNGNLVNTYDGTIILPRDFIPDTAQYRLGLQAISNTFNWDGEIDNFKFYDNARQNTINGVANNKDREGFLIGRAGLNKFNRIKGIAA